MVNDEISHEIIPWERLGRKGEALLGVRAAADLANRGFVEFTYTAAGRNYTN